MTKLKPLHRKTAWFYQGRGFRQRAWHMQCQWIEHKICGHIWETRPPLLWWKTYL